MLAVAEQEGGKPGQKIRNSNGTYDYGVMQINTVSLVDLRSYGINENHVLAEGCYPYFLAAWRIAGHIAKDPGDLWQRAANYHSRTPYYNQIYREKLLRWATKISTQLDIKKSVGELPYKPTAQTGQSFTGFKPTPNPQQLTAYSAPIRVKGFDNVNAHLFKFKHVHSFEKLLHTGNEIAQYYSR
jgi:hypothetical protein